LLFCFAVADAEEVGLAPQKHLAFGDGGRRHEHVIRERVGRHDFEICFSGSVFGSISVFPAGKPLTATS
jgi:hypothetical protein